MTSHAVALVTAVAVSGTVILIALCRQKPFSVSAGAADRNSTPPWRHLRSCISSSGNTGNTRKKQQQRKKRVQFAAEVAEFSCSEPAAAAAEVENQEEERSRARGMPANRVALYNGILRDRVMQRMACCY
ncbi:hypothetical protein OPV22_025399 [Ensete ventricosum]|uniref:Uncharacterized protein n=1 Tax=Ensete ventricosum TaxID=4639 RepID=A0AAV8P9J3_ENSVE|nr:hypothetical protein OPV22_025399 [Ensete ventricosum]